MEEIIEKALSYHMGRCDAIVKEGESYTTDSNNKEAVAIRKQMGKKLAFHRKAAHYLENSPSFDRIQEEMAELEKKVMRRDEELQAIKDRLSHRTITEADAYAASAVLESEIKDFRNQWKFLRFVISGK